MGNSKGGGCRVIYLVGGLGVVIGVVIGVLMMAFLYRWYCYERRSRDGRTEVL